jgi:hypothetical protein
VTTSTTRKYVETALARRRRGGTVEGTFASRESGRPLLRRWRIAGVAQFDRAAATARSGGRRFTVPLWTSESPAADDGREATDRVCG